MVKSCSKCHTKQPSANFSRSNHRCRPCQREINEARNPARNYLSSRAYSLAGFTHSSFYSLGRAERIRWRSIARTLVDIGSSWGTAESAEKRRRDGVVYVVSHPALRGVKIGRAFDSKGRLAHYQTGCPDRAYQLDYSSPYVSDVAALEREIHTWLAPHRLSGEWYDITADVARDVVAACAQLIKQEPDTATQQQTA